MANSRKITNDLDMHASTRTPHQLRARLAARDAPRARAGSPRGRLDARQPRARTASRRRSLGVWWGLGHTLSLLVVGAVLVVLRAEMTPRVSDAFELCVALMLVGLGVARRPSGGAPGPGRPAARPSARHVVHSHPGVPAHVHVGRWTLARRPLLVGAIHGLAGSGALTALVLTTLPTTAARITYMSLFGLGSTLGMAALSGLLGWPLARLGAHHAVARGISLAVGCVSIGLGLIWGYPLMFRLM